jgi:hypothetical protein
MKLYCKNCEDGPCKLESNVEMEFNKHNQHACYFKGIPVANWAKLSPIPEWKSETITHEPKEPELMTFAEARKKAKKGDVLKLSIPGPSDGYFVTEIKVGFNHYFNLTWDQYDSDQWEIIPAEPKVKTFEEIIKDDYPDYNRGGVSFGYITVIDLMKKASEQQWLNHKELREAVENVLNQIDQHNSVSDVAMGSLKEALKNLKPLKAE